MSEHPDVVVLTTAKTGFEAKVIVSVLQGENIPAYSGTGMLNDEFAATQALMNLQNVEIKVPGNRLEDAKKALAEARAAKKFLESDDFDPSAGDAPDEA